MEQVCNVVILKFLANFLNFKFGRSLWNSNIGANLGWQASSFKIM